MPKFTGEVSEIDVRSQQAQRGVRGADFSQVASGINTIAGGVSRGMQAAKVEKEATASNAALTGARQAILTAEEERYQVAEIDDRLQRTARDNFLDNVETPEEAAKIAALQQERQTLIQAMEYDPSKARQYQLRLIALEKNALADQGNLNIQPQLTSMFGSGRSAVPVASQESLAAKELNKHMTAKYGAGNYTSEDIGREMGKAAYNEGILREATTDLRSAVSKATQGFVNVMSLEDANLRRILDSKLVLDEEDFLFYEENVGDMYTRANNQIDLSVQAARDSGVVFDTDMKDDIKAARERLKQTKDTYIKFVTGEGKYTEFERTARLKKVQEIIELQSKILNPASTEVMLSTMLGSDMGMGTATAITELGDPSSKLLHQVWSSLDPNTRPSKEALSSSFMQQYSRAFVGDERVSLATLVKQNAFGPDSKKLIRSLLSQLLPEVSSPEDVSNHMSVLGLDETATEASNTRKLLESPKMKKKILSLEGESKVAAATELTRIMASHAQKVRDQAPENVKFVFSEDGTVKAMRKQLAVGVSQAEFGSNAFEWREDTVLSSDSTELRQLANSYSSVIGVDDKTFQEQFLSVVQPQEEQPSDKGAVEGEMSDEELLNFYLD